MEAKKSRNLCIRKMCSSSPGKAAPPPPRMLSSVALCSSDKNSHSEESSTSRVAAMTTSRRSSNSDADNDDFTTIHFKAAALEAAASSGQVIDWPRMKSFMVCGAKSNENTSLATDGEAEATEMFLDKKLFNHKMKNAALDAVLHKEFMKAMVPDDGSFCSSCDEDCDVLYVPEGIQDADIPEFNLPIEDDDAPSLVDETNPTAALAKILKRSNYNPFDENYLHLPLFFKTIVSLTQLSLRKDNLIEMEIKKSFLMEYSKSKKDRSVSPFMDISNILVKHHSGEFFTFCSCKKCSEYREVVVHVMVEQFKAAHMVIMLLDVLIRAYSPMLKNETAHNKFEKLLDSNKGLHWITCGFIYTKKMEQMDFIYDESLSENMILVLFSSILMVNNPVMLLQVLSFHIECIVKAYAEGFSEIVEPDSRIPAEEMLTYILDGYDDLCRISDQISTFFFAFENYFLSRFSLTWSLLCQRLYQQHVFINLTDTMLACIITLKEEELTSRHAKLIRKYIQFDDRMCFVERCWTKAWIELNKLNLSEVERKRRKSQLTVYRIFDTVVQDAIAFKLQESDDDHDFYDFECLENRLLAWQNLMVYTKMKWPNGFFELPNTLVCDDKCKKCNVMLEYHSENCKCITCSIAGGPLPPRRCTDHTCYKCLAHSLVDKDMQLYESKLLNVCASDDFHSFVRSSKRQKNTTLEQLGKEVSASMLIGTKTELENKVDDSDGTYHISWALFKHFKNRKRYRYEILHKQYFCRECSLPACMIACKILDCGVNSELAIQLVQYYQPISMTEEEIRAVLPNIMLYNPRMRGANSPYSTSEINDFIVKSYWIFVMSVYATYFMELDKSIPPNLAPFKCSNNDIELAVDLETLCQPNAKNKNDIHFFQFLTRVKSLSPFSSKMESDYVFSFDVHTEEFQKKLDQFLELYKKQPSNPLKENPQTQVKTFTANPPNAEVLEKKTTKEKIKKCCFEHSDVGDHCKENHTSKKRLKKECNHARMNETRDRLRKKLSLLVNARKNVKAMEDLKQQQVPQNDTKEKNIPTMKQPPSLKSVATAAAVANSAAKTKVTSSNSNNIQDDSLESLSSLCKRFSHLQTSTTNNAAVIAAIKKQNTTKECPVAAAVTIAGIQDNNQSSQCVKTTTRDTQTIFNNNSNILSAQGNKPLPEGSSNGISCNQTKKCTKPANDTSSIEVVNEIYELIDIYSKDQSKVNKWLKETLSYIEGDSSALNGNGKKQPQPTNPKKAAKKAKQKQRKEEEKRIADLQDLRWQFHDIYFKEFTDKQKLKTEKMTKKRDKKKIAELEVNIKKLQRAKAKVETFILELIATVKQTNSEFKFSYLPTKEQQLEKLQELDSTMTATASEPAARTIQLIAPMTPLVKNYGIPFGNQINGNQYPYHLDFQAHAVAANGSGIGEYGGILRPPIATPLCYAPSQPQQLPPDVVAAMASNAAACNSNVDPSKRIVTIRRINLPNVPEPQVTVTAKGSSPDKDKLLYTFVNGQLVQTESAIAPSTSPPTALLTPLPPSTINTQMPLYPDLLPKQSPEVVFRLPLPPQTKTQKKKERRLLAKLSMEKTNVDTAIKSVHVEMQSNENHINKINTKKKKYQPSGEQIEENELVSASPTSKKHLKHLSKVKKSNIPTPCRSDVNKRLQSERSNSVTTSCSVETSASATPFSSQVTTRENSVCSLKPKGSKKCYIKNLQQTVQLPQKKNVKHKAMPVKGVPKPKAEICPSTPPTVDVFSAQHSRSVTAQDNCDAGEPEKKIKRQKRSKLVDQGQFDNNPFRSLHMQDSDSDCYSSGDEDVSLEDINETTTIATATQPIKPILKSEAVPICKSVVQRKETEIKSNQVKVTPKELLSNVKTVTVKQTRLQQKPGKVTIEEPSVKNNNISINSVDKQRGNKSILPTIVDATPRSQLVQQQSKSRESVSRKQQTDNPKSKRSDIYLNEDRIQQDKLNKCNTNTLLTTNTAVPRGSNCNIRRQKKPSATPSVPAVAVPVESGSNKAVSKRAQRQAQRRQKMQHKGAPFSDCGAGIPNHMDYFNPNDVILTPSSYISNTQNLKQQEPQHYGLTQQMQNLNISNTSAGANLADVYGNSGAQQQMQPVISANVSIMDQLNRGVQVENLSLPPGITLTKVDPVKSEQLRQKSESIKKLSKPLQQQQPNVIPPTFHAHAGATILAPSPVSAMPAYYGLQYSGVATSAMDQNGIIMVEANSVAGGKMQNKQVAAAAAAASACGPNGKTSKSKKRRNKAKLETSTRAAANSTKGGVKMDGTSEMITLRNPMFHSGPAAAAATILQQPGLLPNRTLSGVPMPTPLPMDQPAAIIKNENGMFTIRNPALHQAVTNGLALGGYRQFGNVNYYTPQEAAAEAVRATKLNAEKMKVPTSCGGVSTPVSSTFSYFSSSTSETSQTASSTTLANVTGSSISEVAVANDASNENNTHNTISISCTSVDNIKSGLTGDAAIIARPTSAVTKCISAIGSEVKNAQQQKQKSKECLTQSQWINFGPDRLNNPMSLNTAENTCTPGFLGPSNSNIGGLSNVSLQEKYQQSSYYNGFEVFASGKAGSVSANSLFDGGSDHMHHNCGDESPPPTITGYNSYLEGIPNTGVIRYDDATFLKNLIPGQNLNNEVSIHSVNDPNCSRNISASPVIHQVEITPVYATSRPTSTNLYKQQQYLEQTQTSSQPQQSFMGYRENLSDFGHEGTLFTQNNLLNMSDTPSEVENYQPFNYDFENSSDKVIDFNDLVLKKSSHSHSQRTSPYLDESTIDNFVQNINTLQIGSTTPAEEKCSLGLNGSSSNSSAAGNTNSSGVGGGRSNSSNGGWW